MHYLTNIFLKNQWPNEELRSRSKHRLASDILTSIKNNNKIYNKIWKAKNQTRKQLLLEKFKTNRNFLVNLTRERKESYYNKHFEENNANLITIWEGTKQIILINKSNKTQPAYLKMGDKIINDKKNQKNSITCLEQSLKKLIKKQQNPINSS